MTPFYRGTRFPLLGADEIRWPFREEFTTDEGAPPTSPRNCEPGPGTALIRDVESEIALASGWAEFTVQAISPVYAEQDIVFDTPAIARAAGVAIINKFRCTTDGSFYPLALVTSTTPTWNATHVEAAFHRAATALSLTATYNATAGPIIATFVADGTLYWLALILDAAGQKYLIKGGAFTNWTLLFRSATGATATLYAALAGYNAIFGADFARQIPDTISSDPLLSDTFAGTWPTPDVIGGSWLGLTTWAIAAGVVANTPVEGADKVPNGTFDSGDNWNAPVGGWTISGGKAVHAAGVFGDMSNTAASQIVAHRWYLTGVTVTRVAESTGYQIGGTIVYPIIVTTTRVIRTINTTVPRTYSDTSFAGTLDNMYAKPLPISTLITNQQLATTDVLAEMVISAYTLGSQVGIVQSDRPFAFQANANAADSQPVIVLKGLTHEVPDTDTLTIVHPIAGGTNYTIASVGALSGGVQTITLDDNLVEAVSENDMVGVDWASWNGSLHYFGGSGKINTDEILAGVYTNKGSNTKAFSAGARLIVRKVGDEYRIFYGEALIGSALGPFDAASMTGQYWGMFSTLAANTISSFVAYDTGNVTNAYSILDKYSFD